MDETMPCSRDSILAAEAGPANQSWTPRMAFEQYAPRVYNLARRLLGSAEDAQDVTQDVLVQVIRKLSTRSISRVINP